MSGDPVGAAHVHGYSDATGLLGNGTFVTLPAMSVVFEPDPAKWHPGVVALKPRTTLLKASDGQVATAVFTCERRPEAGADYGCKLQSPNFSRRYIPDAYGAHSELGLGPFVGRSLAPGDEILVETWDPTGNISVLWQVAEGGRDAYGRACVWLEGEKPAASKSTALFAPLWGKLLACDGLGLPAVLEHGPIVLSLLNISATGEAFEGQPVRFPTRTVLPPCDVLEPAKNFTILPVGDWMEWARENDRYVQGWFEDHPSGLAMAGYGRSTWPEWTFPTQVSRAKGFNAPLRLVDPAQGTTEANTASEFRSDNQYGPSSETSWEYEPVEGPGVLRNLTGQPGACDGTLDLLPAANRLIGLMGGPFPGELVSVEPVVSAANWVSELNSWWPFNGGEGQAAYPSSSWPARIVVQASPPREPGSTGGVANPYFASAEPTSGWIRWLDDGRPSMAV